ncbi:hypothetical protein GCM10025870_13720 [Agromyces marinus]|uniref:Uncharacterized protein n=1 Tax=Agromyces marinus TaxID=1389020 RepID=A0ABM8H0K6_9MICO|nr:hypothetical protein [Agromyces marinus]BDZ54299.1 hypothetical protein GCM10025870_13720 [Agromyces marinus]
MGGGGVEVAPEDEGHLGLDARLEEAPEVHRFAVGHDHVVEEHAVVGRVHPELRLDGGRGQPDLAADDAGALGDPPIDAAGLHGVRGVLVEVADEVAYGCTGGPGCRGLAQPGGGGVERGRVERGVRAHSCTHTFVGSV